jgi:hypothetical protein
MCQFVHDDFAECARKQATTARFTASALQLSVVLASAAHCLQNGLPSSVLTRLCPRSCRSLESNWRSSLRSR